MNIDSQDLQATITVEKLIAESTSATQLQPNVEKFEKIIQIVCRNETM